MSRELPISFTTPMVKAILAGRKTETRRPPRRGASIYQPGDRLWVREAHAFTEGGNGIIYRADGPGDLPPRWRPPMFMPRKYARLWLVVLNVKLESLHQMTVADAMDEGFVSLNHFASYWDTLNAKRGAAWASNPAVRVIEFDRIR